MNHIKKMHIEGLKRYKEMDVEFNENMNIIVGENESGKSTILEAVRIVLNQMYKNADKAILKDLFNIQLVEGFKTNPCVDTLPYIVIELDLELDRTSPNAEYFYGQNNRLKNDLFGIRFECRYDQELGAGLESEITQGKIPYEYYYFQWTTYAGLQYKMVKRPLNYILIDTSDNNTNNTFNYYNKALFESTYSDEEKMIARNDFRDKVNDAFSELELKEIEDNRRFGINQKKVVFDAILSVYEDNVQLENKGKGVECLVKTEIALNKRKTHLDTIMIEEPENHLSYSNLQKMLYKIKSRQAGSQIIVTTHNDLIASRLNLKNVKWINNNTVVSLEEVNKDVAEFFEKADGNAFLQLLLSEKVILVEGATEYMLMPKIYSKVTGRTLEEDGVNVISCRGISYKRYLEIAKKAQKRMAIITDNDGSQKKIDTANSECDCNQSVFMDTDIGNWTWEVCLYNSNKIIMDDIIEVNNTAKYLVNGQEIDNKVIAKMLNNKTDIAYYLLKNKTDFEIPNYVKEAIEWLNQ